MMGYNLLIADDEYFIRQRIKKIIPWEALDLQFVGEAENGAEVIGLLSQFPVDIAILDIKMPKISGLATAEYIHTNYPLIQIIILSGYNDFEYARSAFRFGVSDYLLKPVDGSSLENALFDCTSKIKAARNHDLENQKYVHYKRCSKLYQVLNSSLSLKDFFDQYPAMKAYNFSVYISVFINDPMQDGITTLIGSLRSHNFDCEYLKELDYTYMIHIFLKDKEQACTIEALLHDFITASTSYVFLAISPIFPITEPWRDYYTQTLYTLSHRFFYETSTLYTAHTYKNQKNYSVDLYEIRKKIIFLLNSKNEKDFSNYLDDFFKLIKSKENCHYMHLAITEIFMTYNIYFPEYLGHNKNITDFVTSLIDEEYQLNHLHAMLLDYGIQCIRQNNNNPSDIKLSKKIMHYVEENYRDPNLSVNQIALFFQLNPSYIGSIFKRVNNDSILQYITTVRMEASKKLLESTQYKISDIAERVGYSDVFYFSKRFKKMYGYPPKEYFNRKN
ncbi:MAG: response regulator [Cellulosilyticaceae bacterium]